MKEYVYFAVIDSYFNDTIHLCNSTSSSMEDFFLKKKKEN